MLSKIPRAAIEIDITPAEATMTFVLLNLGNKMVPKKLPAIRMKPIKMAAT